MRMSSERTSDAGADVAAAFEALSGGDIVPASELIERGLHQHPQDSRFRVLKAALADSDGRRHDAFAELWRALAAEPDSVLARDELLRLAVTPRTDPLSVRKNFALASGERQTATKLEQIRADHRVRYALAARWLRERFATPRRLTGLDVFCGNGYGSRMVSDLAGVRMLGLDGSAEAVATAQRAYGSHRTVFGHALFPFQIDAPLFDFAISFESVEHVDDSRGLIEQMACATDGPLIVSVPNEPGLPFARFGHRFEHHVRHFERAEIVELLASVGRTRIVAEYGQQVYRIERGDMVGLVPEAEMGLRPFDAAGSQFLILIAEAEATG
ncbi:hypothetical protein CKO43_09195 [Rubrivivax gelatinosus]|uniref:Methyltransferase type 11 domain-containing protein n=2 Tax=Rubrivivax gelatinosus TaxID=28068 RepID=A0ABS1DVY2_RUBGE|nr:hypothetical protein [Rubrivivax gelatinosus]